MNRREFLRLSGAAGATLAWGGTLGCARANSGARDGAAFSLANVGLQLYTVRQLMQQNPERTLEQVKAAGYPIVETAGLYNMTPTAFRAMLDRVGLRTTSGHYPLEQFEKEGGAALFDMAKTLGQEFVILPSTPAAAHNSLAAYDALADRFNRIGEQARAAGLRFGYHNHNFEFETFGGSTPAYETLVTKTDPALVSFELDAYWAYKAGQDPVRYFERFPGRFSLLHAKDGTAPPERAMADVGKGVIDFNRLFSLAGTAGLRYAFVEHDQPTDALASIRSSHDHLARLLRAA